jgi:hypothetical protein
LLFLSWPIYWKEGPLFNNNWRDKPYSFYHSALAAPKEESSTFDADYNLYFNPNASPDTTKFNGLTWADWQKAGKDLHSLYADPLFEDAAKFDFRLQPRSPALKLGFKPIDTSQVGVRSGEE